MRGVGEDPGKARLRGEVAKSSPRSEKEDVVETIALLIIVLLFGLPLLMLAAPISVYLVPAVLIGLTISYCISYWVHRRRAHR